VRTFWHERPDDVAIKEPALEVVLPENAELSELGTWLLAPRELPGLWITDKISLRQILDYFAGGKVVKIPRQGYDEPLIIPKVGRAVVFTAVSQAVKEGLLWFTTGPASIFAEEMPAGILNDDATLQAPPPLISSVDILPASLPEAWRDEITSALGISSALSVKYGQTLPWRRVRDAIDGATRARYLETTLDSAAWPVDYPAAQNVRLRVPTQSTPHPTPPLPPPAAPPGTVIASADLRPNELQDLADALGELGTTASGADLKYHLRIELSGKPSKDTLDGLNKILQRIKSGLKF
jgi:hypothetical protein